MNVAQVRDDLAGWKLRRNSISANSDRVDFRRILPLMQAHRKIFILKMKLLMKGQL